MFRGLIIFFLLFFTSELNAQSFLGEWNSNDLVLDSLIQEYILERPSEVPYSNYGDHVVFKENYSFYSRYSAPCGLDCFTTSIGEYKIVDKDYIRLSLDTIRYAGTCSKKTSKHSFPFEIGLFYMYISKDQIRLVKSGGDLVADKLKMSYSILIDSVAADNEKFENLLDLKETSVPVPMDLDSITSYYKSTTKTNNCKALFMRKTEYKTVVLLEQNNEYKYLICRTGYSDSLKSTILKSYALYDKTNIMGIEPLVDKIDESEHKYRIKSFEESDEGIKRTTTVFFKGKVIKKIMLQYDYFKAQTKMNSTYYFKDENLIYIREIRIRPFEEEYITTGKEFFVIDGNRFVSREISHIPSRIQMLNYSRCLERIEKIKQQLEEQ